MHILKGRECNMNTKSTLLALAACMTAITTIALALGEGVFTQDDNFLNRFASLKAASSSRNVTITYGNTYRGLYRRNLSDTKFEEDINSVFFKMQDNQAYGYIHTSGSIKINPSDNCIAAVWSEGSMNYFEVNSDYMQNTPHYTSASYESEITMVEFRKPTQIVVVLHKGIITDRCLDISCNKSSSSSYVDDDVANLRTYTYVIRDDIGEGEQIKFNAEDAAGGRAIWIRSMTFYYEC